MSARTRFRDDHQNPAREAGNLGMFYHVARCSGSVSAVLRELGVGFDTRGRGSTEALATGARQFLEHAKLCTREPAETAVEQ